MGRNLLVEAIAEMRDELTRLLDAEGPRRNPPLEMIGHVPDPDVESRQGDTLGRLDALARRLEGNLQRAGGDTAEPDLGARGHPGEPHSWRDRLKARGRDDDHGP